MLSNDNNLSKVHAQHVGTDQYNFACYECHGATVNGTYNIIEAPPRVAIRRVGLAD